MKIRPMKFYKLLLPAITSFLFCSSYAQQADREQAVKEIKQLAATYLNASLMSFDLSYYYAEEKQPAVYLDSLKGNCRINGSRYWYSLDNTEMLSGNQYVVILYKEDQVMYLASPSQVKSANPLAMLDSMLQNNNQLTWRLTTKDDQKIITINFPKGGMYRKLEYYINANTGLLTRMINLVQSEQLYEPSAKALVTGSNAYSIVEVRFSNYRQNSFEAAILEPAHYFKKEGTTYSTVAPYENYKIFLGNTGL